MVHGGEDRRELTVDFGPRVRTKHGGCTFDANLSRNGASGRATPHLLYLLPCSSPASQIETARMRTYWVAVSGLTIIKSPVYYRVCRRETQPAVVAAREKRSFLPTKNSGFSVFEIGGKPRYRVCQRETQPAVVAAREKRSFLLTKNSGFSGFEIDGKRSLHGVAQQS